jgi:hypothetical protein
MTDQLLVASLRRNRNGWAILIWHESHMRRYSGLPAVR